MKLLKLSILDQVCYQVNVQVYRLVSNRVRAQIEYHMLDQVLDQVYVKVWDELNEIT